MLALYNYSDMPNDANPHEHAIVMLQWPPPPYLLPHREATGAVSWAIAKLSNQIHKQILFEEQHVSNLQSLKGKFGLMTSATTTAGLLKVT